MLEASDPEPKGLFMRFQGDNDDTTKKGGEKAFLNEPLPRAEVDILATDGEGMVKCPLHRSDEVLPDCLYCHARVQSLVARAEANVKQCPRKVTLEEVVRTYEKGPDRPELIYSSLLSAKQIPEKRWVAKSGNVHMVPAMIGIEGIRVDIPDPDTPLARWRYNLRESLSYSILVTSPDVMIHDVKKDWTDIQCIEMLSMIQQEHQLVEGTIPACVYAAAINYFTNRALDESLANNDEVESWGLRPKLPPPEIIRKRKVILLTDSGSLLYRGKKKSKPANFLNTEAEWSNIMAPDVVGGAAWSDWVTYLEKFVTNYSHLKELCPDNVMRFPAHISVIVLDNLNGTNI